jgi:hypothetical protein
MRGSRCPLKLKQKATGIWHTRDRKKLPLFKSLTLDRQARPNHSIVNKSNYFSHKTLSPFFGSNINAG